jgi:hypothetical protein
VRTGQLSYSPGYLNTRREGEPIAPWRMLNRQTCDALGWRGWNDTKPKFLDSQFYPKLKAMNLRHQRLHLRTDDLFMCDLKSDVNLHPWRHMPHWARVNPAILRRHLSPGIISKITALRG